MTESFLASFVISVSDLLLVVIDSLTFSEQKLLNKIKGEIKIKKAPKKLFVIHNLKTYRTIEQVELYVSEVLLKSLTFQLRKEVEDSQSDKKYNFGYHFTEINQKDLKIFHLIFAADGSYAGDYYNKYTIDFIEGQYSNDWKKESFDAVEEIKAIFSDYSPRYLEQKIYFNDFKSTEDDLKDKVIKLRKEEKLSLKKCNIDEIGLQKFNQYNFEPKYNYFINGNIFEIRVELPGNVEPTIYSPKFIGEYTIIMIKGEKKKDKYPKNIEDNIFNTREFGKFGLGIKFKTEDYKIIPDSKNCELNGGILFLKYELELCKEKEEKIEFLLEEDDFIYKNDNYNLNIEKEIQSETNKLNKEIGELRKQLNEERNKNKVLEDKIKVLNNIIKINEENKNNKINNYVNEIENYIDKMEKMNNNIEKLLSENKNLKDKINSQNNLNNNRENDIIRLYKKVEDLTEIINRYPFILEKDEKMLSIIFMSVSQKVNYSMICKNTDTINKIEAELYKKYPELSETDNYFLCNGTVINKFKMFKEFNIKNGDIFIINQRED